MVIKAWGVQLQSKGHRRASEPGQARRIRTPRQESMVLEQTRKFGAQVSLLVCCVLFFACCLISNLISTITCVLTGEVRLVQLLKNTWALFTFFGSFLVGNNNS